MNKTSNDVTGVTNTVFKFTIIDDDRKLDQTIRDWTSANVSQRQRLHDLLCSAVNQVVLNHNPTRLTQLIQAVQTLRHINTSAVMNWIWLATGGEDLEAETAGTSTAVILPKLSLVVFNAEKCSFSLRKMPKEHTPADLERRNKRLAEAAENAYSVPFWTFAPERIPNPYSFNSFLSALNKAVKNMGSLDEQSRLFIRDILNNAEQHGIAVEVPGDISISGTHDTASVPDVTAQQ